MNGLNEKELEILRFVKDCIERDGYAPAVRDICHALGIRSTSTVHGYLHRLNEKGYLQLASRKSRALRLESNGEEGGEQTRRVPILGRVTAGAPILAIENYDGYVDFPTVMTRGRSNLFALRVMGESMIEAGILNGDIVIVESMQHADDGDIVVAMIEDEATVKRFFRDNGRIRLQPANSAMKPIYAPEVTVLGKVIANFRFY
ncbi:MAG: transcriptional repressor LexA [Clostridia bacterium]|nr:transcriptional repressor LexA [Clostridia bacterium]MBR6553485.1 transcriptional repressor LexA [Clostridia bacterium]